jgi:Domain of unknown function (DUF3471)
MRARCLNSGKSAAFGRTAQHQKAWLSVVLDTRELILRYGGGQSATLQHWHGDTFRARWTNPLADQERPTFVAFQLNEQGQAVALRMSPFDELIEAHRITP